MSAFKNGDNYNKYQLNVSERVWICVLGAILDFVLLYLFYNSIIICLFFLVPTECAVTYMYKKYKIKRRKEALTNEFEEMLGCIASALSAGYSLENAFFEAKRQMALIYKPQADIMCELEKICSGLRINRTAEDLILDMARRTQIDEINNFSEVLSIAKRSGGNFVAIIKQTADIIHDKKEVLESIQTMIAAKKYENRIMSIMPLVMLVYMRMGSPEYISALYGNVQGIIIMTICLIVYIASYMLGSYIMNFDSNMNIKNIRSKIKVRRTRIQWSKMNFLKGINSKIKNIYVNSNPVDAITMFWSDITKSTCICVILSILIMIYAVINDRNQFIYYFLISIVLIIGIPYMKINRIKTLIDKRNEQMLIDYPEVVNKFALLSGAGMNMKNAWERIVKDYIAKRKGSRGHMHYIYEEMNYTMKEMSKGITEAVAYERFGKRVKLLPYMKFTTMLIQNLRKGNRELLQQLKFTSLDALEQRRESMKRRGEEASSKLLFPMMLQFMLILIIILYPALTTL